MGFMKGYYNMDSDVESKNAIATLQMYWETVFAETEDLASFWGFLMQMIFQTSAGAVLFTDIVYWLGLFPLMKELGRSYDFLEVNLHGTNAVFILADVMLNRMSFPWFRGAYFTLWTGAYVLFQWSAHAFGLEWWPYPFLDPTKKYAPIWYLILCGGHMVCYGFVWGVAKVKRRLITCISN
ncbi:hypothetical protein KP509_23G086200 [Ceratopteris richardii]|nr:hypothetical protein KP509_23G086200 [Ceratopteris richardii]